MKKIILFICLILCLKSVGQSNVKDYKTIFYQEVILETDDYKLFLVKCFSRADILKIKLRVFNKTKDIIYVKPEEFKFNINGNSYNGFGRTIIVQPNGDEQRFVDVKGADDMRCEKFEVTLNGFYKLSLSEAVYEMPNYELPAKRGSEFTAGPMKCEIIIQNIQNDKSVVNFKCSYTGDKVGIVDPYKCSAIYPSGKENNNSISKQDVYIIENGASEDFNITFSRLAGAGKMTDGFYIKWNDTFKSSTKTPLKTSTVPMVIDLTKSEK